jgi:hypothetical protein
MVIEARRGSCHRRLQTITHPPSTLRVCPVMKDDSGPEKNNTAAASSSNRPRRFCARESMIRRRARSSFRRWRSEHYRLTISATSFSAISQSPPWI